MRNEPTTGEIRRARARRTVLLQAGSAAATIARGVVWLAGLVAAFIALNAIGPCDTGWRFANKTDVAALESRLEVLERQAAIDHARLEDIHSWTRELRSRFIGPLPTEAKQ